MQLSNIATASIATLKSFARQNGILPEGDLRLKSTWLEAVQTFLAPATETAIAVIATATSPEAVQFYKASAVATYRFTYRTFLTACLLTIALGMSARDTWESFCQWLEPYGLTPQQPVLIVRLVIYKARQRVKRFALQRWDRLQRWLESQTVRAWHAVDEGITQPAQEFRQRISAARFVITR